MSDILFLELCDALSKDQELLLQDLVALFQGLCLYLVLVVRLFLPQDLFLEPDFLFEALLLQLALQSLDCQVALQLLCLSFVQELTLKVGELQLKRDVLIFEIVELLVERLVLSVHRLALLVVALNMRHGEGLTL